MTSMEIVDPYLVTALKLLHSSASDSAEKLRIMLDNEISKNHEKSKLLTNLLTKKQMNDEKNAPGSGFKKHKPKKSEEVKVVRAQTPPETIPINDDSSEDGDSENVMDDMLLDISCVTCRTVDNTANNQLYECTECHNLYHQLCHDPKISNETLAPTWICSSCKSKTKSSSRPKESRYDSPSSSSSSSSNKKPAATVTTSKSAEKKKPESSSSSSKKKSTEKSSSSSSSRSRSSKK